jgi:hypothetical protein
MVSESRKKLPTTLYQQMERAPQEKFDLILRVTQASDPIQKAIEQAGCTVRYRLTLVPSFAVTAPGRAVLALLDHPWLLSVEPDQPVKAF